MSGRDTITINPGQRGGQPCLRGTRIAVADILGWLSAGVAPRQICEDFPELTVGDIRACREYAANSQAPDPEAA